MNHSNRLRLNRQQRRRLSARAVAALGPAMAPRAPAMEPGFPAGAVGAAPADWLAGRERRAETSLDQSEDLGRRDHADLRWVGTAAWAERMALAAIKCQAAMECLAPMECPAMDPVAAAMPSPVDRIAAPVALSEAAGVDRKSYPLAAVKDLVQATAAARRTPGRAPVHFPD